MKPYQSHKINRLLKPKSFIVILMCLTLLGGCTLYIHSIPPRSEEDTLRIMRLDSSTQPVIQMASQLSYSPDLIQSLIEVQLTEAELSPIDSEAKLTAAEMSPIDSDAKLTTAELSPIRRVDELNLLVTIDENLLGLDSFIEDLSYLLDYCNQLNISLIPHGSLNENEYIDWGMLLSDAIDKQSLTSIHLIWYPQNKANFIQYVDANFENIGISIYEHEDIDKLDNFYEVFSQSKQLYVSEHLSLNASSQNVAIKAINKLYYLLAIDYPKFQVVFSPYLKAPYDIDNPFSLSRSSEEFFVYEVIYNRLLNKPWLTTSSTDPVIDISPYKHLNSYDVLSGKVEILLAPDSTLLEALSESIESRDTSAQSSYLTYRLEEMDISVQPYYPYVFNLDTTTLPNGVSKLKAIILNDSNKLTALQSVDLSVNNPLSSQRPARRSVSFALEEQPSYTGQYIPILMYHTIADTVAGEDQNSCVETTVFESHIKGLLEAGYTPINFKTLYDYVEGVSGLPEKPILLTMDDGYLNNYTHAFPIYQKYNVQATLFVSPYYMKEENTERHFGWKAASEMEDSGLIDLQSHGYNHTPFPYLSLKDLRQHITRSRGLIEQHLGQRDVFVVACPQFRNTKYTRALLEELGVNFQITKLARTGTVLNPTNLKRINVPNTFTPEALIAEIEKKTK